MKLGAWASPLAAELELNSGDALQLALTNDPEQTHYDVTVVGALRDRSLLVTHPQRAGQPVAIAEGAGVQARFFMRNQALGFHSSVLRVCTAPFPYLHLGYPARVEPLQERKSTRVRSALAAAVRRAGRLPDEPDTPAIVRDLSALGAMLLTPVPVGVDGDALSIQLRLPLDQVGDHAVTLAVTIRNAQDEALVPGSPWRHRYGVAFGVMEPPATILLRAYLYERFAGL